MRGKGSQSRCGVRDGWRPALCTIAFTLALLPAALASGRVVLTVGTNGTYPTVQTALGGVTNGAVNEIRIQSGTYVESVVIYVTLDSGELHVSGGWDQTFSTQTANPALTVIDGNGVGRCMFVELTGASSAMSVSFSNLTFTGGAADYGGGVYLATYGNVHYEISRCRITGSTAIALNPKAGGLLVQLANGGRLELHDSTIDLNLAQSNGSGGYADGGGAYIALSGTSVVYLQRVVFSNNQAEADTEIRGAGLSLWALDDAATLVADSRFVDNEAVFSSFPVYPAVSGTGAVLTTFDSAWVEMRRNTLSGNSSQAGYGDQLELFARNASQLGVWNTEVEGGYEGGVLARAYDTAALALANLTVVDNFSRGLLLELVHPTAFATVINSILYGSFTDLVLYPGSGTIPTSNNLVGIDPLFVDRFGGDYRLAAGSPAENAGTSSQPPGVGYADCLGGVRVLDGAVDIGAHEGVNVLFSNAFESGTSDLWTQVVP